MRRLLYELRWVDAAREFERWVYATDKRTGKKRVVHGLVKRRFVEEAWFLGGSEPLIKRLLRGRW